MGQMAIRLKPGSDIKRELETMVQIAGIRAAWIVTCAGSLRTAVIRLAGMDYPRRLEGKYEIVSLTGTLSPSGSHLHAAIADSHGETLGGHLEDGCIVYTTAEIVVGTTDTFHFKRCYDPETGHNELEISPDRTEN
ncbi:DNA-binding protein [bacterium]|nr:DNA-binding protein [candidate division CSSED10-310 bacterium]